MTPQRRLGPGAPVTRRAALRAGVLGVGAIGVAGCSVDNPLNNPLDDERTPAARATPDLAPDVAIAVQAVTLVRTAQAAVRRTGDVHPPLEPRIAGLAAMHAAHLRALVDAVPKGVDTSATGPAYVVPADRAGALAGITAAERSLHDALVGQALRAQSGTFARLLGSMAAAVSQQLHGLAA
jgi:hypothetical protein